MMNDELNGFSFIVHHSEFIIQLKRRAIIRWRGVFRCCLLN